MSEKERAHEITKERMSVKMQGKNINNNNDYNNDDNQQ